MIARPHLPWLKPSSLLALLVLVVISGCQTRPHESPHEQLVIGPGASQYLVIESTQEAVADNLLRAGVRLYSRSSLDQDVRYRFEWLDQNGFELPGLAGRWEHLTLKPGLSYSLDRIASSPRATTYRIHIFDRHTPTSANHQGDHQ